MDELTFRSFQLACSEWCEIIIPKKKIKLSYNLKGSCWTVCETQLKAVLFLIVRVWVFVLNERNGLLITYQGSLLWSDLSLPGSLPFITLEGAQQFQLRWDLIISVACDVWMEGKASRWCPQTHQQNPSVTSWVWQQLLGQPMAPAPHWPLQVSTRARGEQMA